MAQQNHIDLPGEFDALLKQALSAEPSAEFLPRVRRRVAGERPRTFSFWTTMSLAGAAVAAALLVALWPGARTEPVVVRPAPEMASVSRPADPPVRPQVEVAPDPRPPLRGAAPARAVRPARSAEPEVIVDRHQHAAIASVLRLVEEGRLTAESFVHTPPPSMQAIREQVTPVGVPVVQVSPIAVGGVMQMGTEK
jgi:hypothetical protein